MHLFSINMIACLEFYINFVICSSLLEVQFSERPVSIMASSTYWTRVSVFIRVLSVRILMVVGELARCVKSFLYTSSGRFDYTEPSLTTDNSTCTMSNHNIHHNDSVSVSWGEFL